MTTHYVITDDDIDACVQAGASAPFLTVLNTEPETVGVEYNLARNNVHKARNAEFVSGDTAEQRLRNYASDHAGHFYQALWSGELAEALYRADTTNSKILLRSFPAEYLLAVLTVDRGSRGSAESWLYPNLERYGTE